ncbi:DUF5658 family protein [Paenibacillus oryzisoli]|uniref:DUF5658 family protein n=1 Tax=Paenibacillus oryzisoli TaxID=1850517 RepID=UPI003D2E3B27
MTRSLILFICIASLLDAGLTDFGLRYELIGESNPIMAFLYDHAYPAFYGVKIFFPLSLFFLAAKIGKHRLVHSLFRLSVVVYMGILLMHAYWISASLSTV